jgi:hypothetical protein
VLDRQTDFLSNNNMSLFGCWNTRLSQPLINSSCSYHTNSGKVYSSGVYIFPNALFAVCHAPMVLLQKKPLFRCHTAQSQNYFFPCISLNVQHSEKCFE